MKQQVEELFEEQAKNWDLFKQNLLGVQSALTKTFAFEGFNINVQFNPKRIVSSSAKTDAQSIEQRPCFLCAENRPAIQRGIDMGAYTLLCNPFPIFGEHYTIAHQQHTPQTMENKISDLLDISKKLSFLVTFYNAPACGASAPDHLHFQAGNKGFMPIEQDLPQIIAQYGNVIYSNNKTTVNAVDDSLRKFLVIQSDSKELMQKHFNRIFEQTKLQNQGEEPMFNLLCYYEEGWRLLIFLRSQHRPKQYYAEDEQHIMFSPGAVDMGGTFITPLKKDFAKINKATIADMLQQVSLSTNQFLQLTTSRK